MLRNGTRGEGVGLMSSISLLATAVLLLGSAMARYIHVVDGECFWCSGAKTWRGVDIPSVSTRRTAVGGRDANVLFELDP